MEMRLTVTLLMNFALDIFLYTCGHFFINTKSAFNENLSEAWL